MKLCKMTRRWTMRMLLSDEDVVRLLLYSCLLAITVDTIPDIEVDW